MKTIQLRTNNTRLITNSVELMPLEKVLDWYRGSFYRAEKEHTSRAKEHDFASLLSFLFDSEGIMAHRAMLSDLTEARLSSWTEWCLEDEAPSTVNRRMATVKHLCNEIKKRVPAWHNPASELSDLPTETIYRGIPEEYQEALIRAAYQLYDEKRPGVRFYRARAGLMVEIALLCGLRAGEILGLTPGHISRDARYFQNVRCKGKKYRTIYIPESLQESLKVYLPFWEQVLTDHYPQLEKMVSAELDKCPLFPTLSREHRVPPFADYKTLWAVFAEASKALAGDHFSPHMARHSFARALMDHTKDVTVVADALGHANVNTSFIYLKSSNEQKAKVIEAALRRVK